jgi:multimeric flavodoxin WrbA
MKAIIISGSRNPDGQTARAANGFLNGFVAGGGEAETVFLPTLKIERCRQCENSGWGICISDGKCVIEDDFALIAEKIQSADIVVFANPVYFADLSESLRAFLDRYRRVRWPVISNHTHKDIPVVLICVAGGSGGGSPESLEILARIVKRAGFQIEAQVPAKRQTLEKNSADLYAIGKKLSSDV